MKALAPVLVLIVTTAGTAQMSGGVRWHLPLSTDAIADATELGLSDATLVPYRLREQHGQPPGPTVALYTPYLRVALAARTARDRQEPLKPSDLPSWITEPSILAVFRIPCRPDHCDSQRQQQYAAAEHLTVLTGPLVIGDDKGLQPMFPSRMTRDLRFLDALGGSPFEGATVAATFDPTAIRIGTSIVAAWSNEMTTKPGRYILYTGGRIAVEDVKGWK